MAGMDVFVPLRKRKRHFMWLVIFAYLCYVVLVVKDPNTLVLLIGVGILFVIFVYPSKRDPKPKPPKVLHHKKTKKYLDFN